MNRRILSATLVIFASSSLALFAQDATPALDPSFRDLGGSIAIPIDPKAFNPRKYEIPELSGSLPGAGTHLDEGRLPKVIADYAVVSGDIRQRITIFSGGLVAVHMSGFGGTIRKRVMIPTGAMKVYRDALSADVLSSIPRDLSSMARDADRATLRIYREDGTFAERVFPLSLILPTQMEQFRSILDDLLRVVTQDRLVTNPMTDYKPVVGDRLIADDKKTYVVRRIGNQGEFIEVDCLQEPVKLYVAVKDLHNYFIASLGQPQR
ncbi:MAG TPA: hypothetical protein VHL58_15850 [Thermoanaerobaculia bacterium]|nr:hypothetical protein [Thermoanaerobaculia bacterium]